MCLWTTFIISHEIRLLFKEYPPSLLQMHVGCDRCDRDRFTKGSYKLKAA